MPSMKCRKCRDNIICPRTVATMPVCQIAVRVSQMMILFYMSINFAARKTSRVRVTAAPPLRRLELDPHPLRNHCLHSGLHLLTWHLYSPPHRVLTLLINNSGSCDCSSRHNFLQFLAQRFLLYMTASCNRSCNKKSHKILKQLISHVFAQITKQFATYHLIIVNFPNFHFNFTGSVIWSRYIVLT